MIEKKLTAFCDECAYFEPLLSQTLKDADIELTNKGWTKEKPHIYCPTCSYNRAMQNKV